jgi:hypothetical protein
VFCAACDVLIALNEGLQHASVCTAATGFASLAAVCSWAQLPLQGGGVLCEWLCMAVMCTVCARMSITLYVNVWEVCVCMWARLQGAV